MIATVWIKRTYMTVVIQYNYIIRLNKKVGFNTDISRNVFQWEYYFMDEQTVTWVLV